MLGHLKDLRVNYEYIVLRHIVNLNCALGCFHIAVVFPHCILLSFLSARFSSNFYWTWLFRIVIFIVVLVAGQFFFFSFANVNVLFGVGFGLFYYKRILYLIVRKMKSVWNAVYICIDTLPIQILFHPFFLREWFNVYLDENWF